MSDEPDVRIVGGSLVGRFESGETAADYKDIEDRAVDQVIAMQDGAGVASGLWRCS